MARERRRVVPDFSREFARCDELEEIYEDGPYWESQCDEWTDAVLEKLQAWDPRLTRRFLVASVFESSAGAYMPDQADATSVKLIELRERRNRLKLLVWNRRRLGWIFGLLRP